MKTVLVLSLGFLFFGKEGLNLQVVLGMLLASPCSLDRFLWLISRLMLFCCERKTLHRKLVKILVTNRNILLHTTIY